MRTRQNSCKSLFKILLVGCIATGCDASGAATDTGQGGNNGSGGNPSVGGSAGDTSNPSVGGEGAGGNPAGGVPGTGGAPPTGGMPATGGYTCTPGTQIGVTNSTNFFMAQYPQMQPFYVFNNGWSAPNTTTLTAAGTQESVSVYDTCTKGTISWKTDYNWSGANDTVKAYPAAILGWQSTKGWPVAQTLLPKTISSIASAQCSWSYSVTGGASQNVAFDIWIHNTTCSTAGITSTTAASDEVMIWLYSNGGVQPAGSRSQAGLSISGATWDLWEGNVGSWRVHSFLRSGNSMSVQNLDILAFLKQLNIGSKCLSSIEAGTEVFQGSGTVNTSSYTCSVQ